MEYNVDFDIEQVRAKISSMSIQEKMKFIEDKDNELSDAIDEIVSMQTELECLKMSIEEKYKQDFYKEALATLSKEGYEFKPTEKEIIKLTFGQISITISMSVWKPRIYIFLKARKRQISFQNIVASLLPEYIHDANMFTKDSTEDYIIDEFVSAIKTLVDNEEKFKQISIQ
ncbi:MAG: hypothetical protein HUK00_05930 [Bacteroidaceae bacterium]|nr:hypothetical protein [Bacteroidaceae bacterium]